VFVVFKKLVPFFTILVISVFGYVFYKNSIYLKSDVIKVVQSASLGGLNRKTAKEFNLGIDAYFSYINDKGGIYGRKIKLVSLDDRYEEGIAAVNAKKLKKEAIAYFGVTDICSSKRILEIGVDENTPFLMPYCPCAFLEKRYKNIYYSFTRFYEDEIEALVKYLSKKEIKKVAIFYENNSCGRDILNSAKNILKKHHIGIDVTTPYERNTLLVDEAYKKISKYEPKALLMFASYRPVAKFLKIAKSGEKYLNTIFMTTSCVGIDALKEELKEYSGNLIVTETVFSPYDKNIPLVDEYQKVLRLYFPNADFGYESLKGFLYAKILVLALKEAGFNLNGQILLKSLKNIPYIKYNKEYLIRAINNDKRLNKIYLLHYKNNNFITFD